jgi:phosphopantothenoylcysteine decarboxylase/phosphopantothenate--cysteine ligase
VTGGIAVYKSVYLLRLLKRAGADVKVVMTESATEFVTPLTFESLSENPVRTHIFETEGKSAGAVSPIEHIDLAKWPEAIVIAPCTANTLANLAHGRADDLLSTIVSAYRGPIVLAPAMNDVMWENEGTRDNMRLLSDRGYRTVPPEKGDLACGYEATGRMAEPESIFEAVRVLFDSPFQGLKVLVSVGGTEEDIDPVRVISNRTGASRAARVRARWARDRRRPRNRGSRARSFHPAHRPLGRRHRVGARLHGAVDQQGRARRPRRRRPPRPPLRQRR